MDNRIKRITDDAKMRGHDIRIRDIAYAALKTTLNDELIAYTVVFGTPEKEADVKLYDSMESIQFLLRWFEKELAPKEIVRERPEDVIKALKKNNTSDEGSITFEENREGIETQIKQTLELINQLYDADGKCTDAKTMATLQTTLAKLRQMLNDKFGASEKSSEQYIIVQPKMNHICEWTHRECWLQTKDYAMEHWHLIEDPNYKGK